MRVHNEGDRDPFDQETCRRIILESRELVRRAIEFDRPPRLPFFLGDFWGERLLSQRAGLANDVCDCWEMDRQKAGWFFDTAGLDDWGCLWEKTEKNNMGQVVGHPLRDWSALRTYAPPDPRDSFYFVRIDEKIRPAGDKYVIVTCHFNLIERLHMLHGFVETMVDFYEESGKIETLLDMILDFKIAQLDELARRIPDRIHGVFLTDDWGTQRGPFVSPALFKTFFRRRYDTLARAIHGHGWHFFLHSCGRVNELVPSFIDAGVDVLNLQQPRAYGIEELGARFAGKTCFLTTVDIQTTLPQGKADAVQQEAADLVANWSTSEGGFIVFNYGDAEAIGTTDAITEIMFKAFFDLAHYWTAS